MIQGRRGFGLDLKASQALGIGGDQLRQNFDRDVAIQLRIAGAIYLAHAASPEWGKDLVMTYLRARGQGHLSAQL
jgi:hypothetical protein